MLIIRKSAERRQTLSRWLDSRHSFSFGDFHDPGFARFGSLCALNEVRLAVGGGFRPHAHQDLEIITYLLDGALSHHDSTGGDAVIGPGQIQRMSAGTGITHSEVNSEQELCRHLQIWLEPSAIGIEPSYEQKMVDPGAIRNRFARIGAPSPRENEIRITQDAELWVARVDIDHEVVQGIARGRKAWLQLVRGEVVLNNAVLDEGDGAAITDEERFFVHAKTPSELILVDLA